MPQNVTGLIRTNPNQFLGQQNITNAYVSGMREDLGAFGNELNYYVVAYNTAYVLGQVPLMTLQTKGKLFVSLGRIRLLHLLTYPGHPSSCHRCRSYGLLSPSANPKSSTAGTFTSYAP